MGGGVTFDLQISLNVVEIMFHLFYPKTKFSYQFSVNFKVSFITYLFIAQEHTRTAHEKEEMKQIIRNVFVLIPVS